MTITRYNKNRQTERYLEGRGWMNSVFKNFTARPVGDIIKGKFYMYQMFTTVFIEFDTMKELLLAKDWLDRNEKYWDYDPITIIDTNKPEDFKVYERFIK